jgi:hypothetical protein
MKRTKHGGPKKRLRRKLHLSMDEETPKIHAFGVTASNVGVAAILADLLEQLSSDQEITKVTTSTRGPSPIIPPRKNAQLWKPTTAKACAQNKVTGACKYLSRALWQNLTGYRQRSRAETKSVLC